MTAFVCFKPLFGGNSLSQPTMTCHKYHTTIWCQIEIGKIKFKGLELFGYKVELFQEAFYLPNSFRPSLINWGYDFY